mgnify:CR=1 FL=1
MNKKKIVIVDDEQDILRTLKIFLEAEGFDVVTASDGVEGLDKIRKENPDAVILDIMLPKTDGYKICRILKFDKKFRVMPVIMFTARAQEEDERMGKEVRADAYITKPFDPDVLLAKLKELLFNL